MGLGCENYAQRRSQHTGAAVTNSSGAYSFTGLTQGTYTITPSLTGYSYVPSPPSVSIGASTVQNFTASSVIPSFSISGTVSGSSDSTHVLYITVYNCGGGTNCSPVAGTTLPSITTNGGAYTIRGLSPSNNYSVRAEIDTLSNGAPNEADPAGTVTGINITSSNVTGSEHHGRRPNHRFAGCARHAHCVPGRGRGFRYL